MDDVEDNVSVETEQVPVTHKKSKKVKTIQRASLGWIVHELPVTDEKSYFHRFMDSKEDIFEIHGDHGTRTSALFNHIRLQVKPVSVFVGHATLFFYKATPKVLQKCGGSFTATISSADSSLMKDVVSELQSKCHVNVLAERPPKPHAPSVRQPPSFEHLGIRDSDTEVPDSTGEC